jgi:PAS domain S-box-containing protein
MTGAGQEDKISQEILDNLLEGCQIIDLEWRYRYLNDTAARQARQEKGDLIGRSMLEVYPGIEHTPLFQALGQCLETQNPQRLLNRFEYPDGAKAWFELYIKPVSEGLLILSLDVTARQEQQVQLEELQRLEAGRQEAMKAQEESEKHFRLLVEHAPDAIFIQTNYCLAYVNPAAVQLFGAESPEQLLGQDVASHFHPDFRDQVRERIRCLNEDRQAVPRVEEIIIRFDGTPVDVEISAVPFTYQQENGALVFVRDITERYLVRDFHQSVLSATPDGYLLANAEGQILDANEAYCRLMNYSHLELLDKTIYDVEAQLSPTDIEQKLPLLAADGGGVFETKHRTRDGRIVDLEVSITYLRWEGGWFVAFLRDITERKQMEQSLRTERNKLRNVLANIPFGVDIVNAGYEIEYINKMLEDDFGPVAGQKCYEYLHDRADICPWCKNAKILAGQSVRWEWEAAKSGKIFDIFEMPMVNEDGSISKLKIFQDITERKRAEEERKKLESRLFQAQKLEAIGTLAGGIAHDFNNILGAILGYTDLLAMSLNEPVQAREYLKEVLGAAHRAKELVAQILAFSRKLETDKKPLSLKLIVEEALTLLRASLPSTIEIRQYLESGSPILADATQMHQVVINLATNASQAMEETGGFLEIILKDRHLEGPLTTVHGKLPAGKYVALTVKDTGPGIDPEITPRIFEPYFTTKEAGKGTGLGLATVQGIVRSHGGDLVVESTPGQGTVLTAYFPRLGETRVITATPDEETIPRGTERILLVDDEIFMANLGKAALGKMGYRVTATTSSREALEIFRANPKDFDLVITDLTMPQLTGVELGKRLMEIRGDVRLILCTGYNERFSREEVLKLGFREFLKKPLGINELGKTVQRVLAKT